MLRRRRKNQGGQAMVESALTLLIFLPMFIGILDFGQFLYFHQALVDRARAGARYAAVHYTASDTQVKNYAVFNNADAADGASPVVGGLTTSMIQVFRAGTPGASNATAGVRISGFRFQYLSPYITGTFSNAPVVAILPSEAP